MTVDMDLGVSPDLLDRMVIKVNWLEYSKGHFKGNAKEKFFFFFLFRIRLDLCHFPLFPSLTPRK